MKTFEVKGTARTAVGKKETKKLRAEGKVPCVLYGGEEPIHFEAEAGEFRHVIYTPNVYLINIEIGGKKYQAIMQDIQFHPVTDEILHIDFLRITEDKPVKINIPVKLTGFAKGIQKGGRLKTNLRVLRVKGLAKNLPDTIDIDVTALGLGESIRVGDVQAEGLEILNNKSVPVASVVITRAARAAMTAAAKGGN
ncbi:50S ribosomal protein L25/general stress protein Ctc [Prolixibacter denitrificans]|uniref:Large ribosomal subunit protein bL25 n=1 Tax=Prolixibacter denitrificans TaxID=1541063 RepID=A0A2P8CCZ7_9BACT|nr:50S ribosomal protein L25/general stress protein Ctc [Prolixibacter denitrificans]PSK82802.1 large subunit ribosomal protein L25 [Prolixibacter denitrificans]GET21383.1 50S ribosomal protein L25 [Prolixibacter denitrificans]